MTTQERVEDVKARFLTGEYSVDEAAYWDRFWRLRLIRERAEARRTAREDRLVKRFWLFLRWVFTGHEPTNKDLD